MSKRENSSSVKWLLQSGYLPEAIANYLILLGNKTPCEVFTLDEAVEWFDISKISKNPAKFDINKLAFLNREHIKRADSARLVEIFGLDESFSELIKFYTQEASLVGEIKEKIKSIFSKKEIPAEFAENVKILKDEILKIKELPENFENFKEILTKATNLKGKNFFMPLRVLLTGANHGPELKELYPLLRSQIKRIVNL